MGFIGKFAEEPRYQGAGSSQVNAFRVDKILEHKDDYKFDYQGYEPGFNFKGKISKKLEKKAVKLAEKCDVLVVFAGLDNVTEAEGLDRENIKIPANQLHLIETLKATGKKIIVVLSAGAVIEIPFAKEVDGLIHSYLPGQAGSLAVLRILQGDANPSGHLAETYPLKLEDAPTFDTFHMHPNLMEYRESIFVGYRYYERAQKPILYPFGYGLSYTKFEYSNLKVSDKGVSFDIKNVGEFDGKATPQLYVGKKDSKIFRAVNELKGFAKELILKGETKHFEIPFDEYTFRYFNVKTNKWEIEDGAYEIYICESLYDIKLEGSISKKGTTDVVPYEEKELQKYFDCDIKNITTKEFEKLLGREIPNHDISFYKKKRLVVDYWTTVEYLRYAKGWTGRLFAWVIRFVIRLMRAFGNKATANTLIMGVLHEPMRGLSRMTGGAIHWEQLDGLITAFNGKTCKGLHKFFKEGRRIKKEEKLRKKAEKNKK